MIPYSKQSIAKEDEVAVLKALYSSHLTQGAYVQAFQKAIGDFIGIPYVLALNSATSALYCAYCSLGIQKGDEVITTPNSYVATSNMLLALGAKPIFCDIKDDGNIDESKIEPLINNTTKAIVSVDYAGHSVEVEKIAAIAKQYNILWISDSSHSFGGFYKDSPVGSFADATIFSFHAIKTITTAEGGAIAFKNQQHYQRALLIHSHGVQKKELWNTEVEEWGFNFRMNELSAALGISQLQRIHSFIARRNEIAQYYDEEFSNITLLKTLKRKPYIKSTHHLYPIFIHQSLLCKKEDIFKNFYDNGLGVQVHYKPINAYKLYGNSTAQTANALNFYRAEISIPCHQELTFHDVEKIIHITKQSIDYH